MYLGTNGEELLIRFLIIRIYMMPTWLWVVASIAAVVAVFEFVIFYVMMCALSKDDPLFDRENR